MEKIQIYTINIGKNPSAAIKQITDPILKKMNNEIEDHEADLKEVMKKKHDITYQEVNLKNQIFESKAKRINLMRRKEEIKDKV